MHAAAPDPGIRRAGATGKARTLGIAAHRNEGHRRRRRAPRRLRRALLLALLAMVAVALLLLPWLHAQWRAALVVGEVVQDVPVVSALPKALTREPRAEEVELAGVPATIMRPAGDGPWPTVVFVTGASPSGRHHPLVQALLRGLARGGMLAVAPDVPGMAEARLSRAGVDSAGAFVRALSRRDEVQGGRVTLTGVSAGASLALVVAARTPASEDVSVVAGIAPLVDLRETLRLATTGTYRTPSGTLREYAADPFLAHAVARLAEGTLQAPADRARFGRALEPLSVGDDDDHARALPRIARIPPSELGAEGRAWQALLANEDPEHFDVRFDALPAAARRALRELSPLDVADGVDARVLIATAPRDSYVPLPLQRQLAGRLPDAELTVTRALDHAIPDASDLPELARFDWWVMHVLRAAQVEAETAG